MAATSTLVKTTSTGRPRRKGTHSPTKITLSGPSEVKPKSVTYRITLRNLGGQTRARLIGKISGLEFVLETETVGRFFFLKCDPVTDLRERLEEVIATV